MTNKSLEERTQGGWIRQAYRNEWQTMPANIIAAATSMGVTALATHLAREHFHVESDEVLTLTATVADLSTYYAALFSQFFYRDRKELKNEENKFSLRKIGRKLGEYASFFGVLTAAYTGTRMAMQYGLQKMDIDPVKASTITQASLTGIFTGMLPTIRYGLKNIWRNKIK